MPNIRVRIGLRNASDKQIFAKGETIYTCMDGNDDYKRSPIDRATLRATLDQFSTDLAASEWGGRASTIQKNSTREKLKSQIRLLGHYIQSICDDNEERVRKAGFAVVDRNRAQSPLPKSVIVSVRHGLSGELIISVRALANAKMYQVESAELPDGQTQGPWHEAAVSSNSRSIRVRGLIPGMVYAFRVRAIGGSTDAGDWSDPVSHRSM